MRDPQRQVYRGDVLLHNYIRWSHWHIILLPPILQPFLNGLVSSDLRKENSPKSSHVMLEKNKFSQVDG